MDIEIKYIEKNNALFTSLQPYNFFTEGKYKNRLLETRIDLANLISNV